MDAIIGRYRVSMEEMGLILKHQSGISFDLTADETLGLLDFINVYRKALLAVDHEDREYRETDPELKRIVIHEQESQD